MSDHKVRPDVAMFLEFLNNQPGPQMYEVSAPEARELSRGMMHLADVEVGELAVNRKINIPGPAGDIPAQIFDTRADRAPGIAMVFFHGGGFVISDPEIYAPYTAEVARQLDIPVISIDYRMGPEDPFPAAPEDCEAATRWIASNPNELGFEVTGLITSGDSAGGNLTIVTTMALRDSPADVPIVLQHPIYPVVSGHDDWGSIRDFGEGYLLSVKLMDWFSTQYKADMTDPRGAPLDFDQTGMPPTLVTTASLDPLRDQGIAYYEAIKKAGVHAKYYNAEGNIHGHINLRKAVPSSNQDVDVMTAMVKEMLAEIHAPV